MQVSNVVWCGVKNLRCDAVCAKISARILFNGMVWTRLRGMREKGGRARRLVI